MWELKDPTQGEKIPHELITFIKETTKLCDAFGCYEDCAECVQRYIDCLYKKGLSQEWIPISSPPEDDCIVQVACDGCYEQAWYFKDTNRFYIDDYTSTSRLITHWLPLPPLPNT